MIVQPDFLDHWKTNALAARIGRLEAITALLALWAHCQQRRAWQFHMTPLMLAGICRYGSENPGVLMETLLELNLLEKAPDGGYIVHDWAETNAALVHNWKAGKTGGRPRKQPQTEPLENPRVNPSQTQGEPEGQPIREEKRREEEIPPVVPQGGRTPVVSSTSTRALLADSGDAGLMGKKKKRGGARLSLPEFPEDLPEGYRAPLADWFAYKQQRGQGYVLSGWAALIAQQRQFPAAAVVASVQASMANGWAGLFTDKIATRPLEGPGKKMEGGGAPMVKQEVPEWDWLAVADALWPEHALRGLRWADLPASTRFELRTAHEAGEGRAA